MLINRDDNFGAPIKSGVNDDLTAIIALGVDSNGDALLATNVSGAGVTCRGFSLTTGVEGSGDYEVDKSRIEFIRHGKIDGFSGFTIGADVYLGAAGAVSTTVTTGTGKLKQKLGFAIAADTLMVEIEQAEEIA